MSQTSSSVPDLSLTEWAQIPMIFWKDAVTVAKLGQLLTLITQNLNPTGAIVLMFRALNKKKTKVS